MDVDGNTVDMILDACSVYPKQDRQTIRNHTERIVTVMSMDAREEPSEKRLVRKISKAMDLKSRMDNDRWIKSEEYVVELEDYR